MVQNNLVARIKTLGWQLAPAPLVHALFGARFQGMTETLRDLKITDTFRVDAPQTGGEPLYGITLADGVKIVSGPPSANQIKMTAPARATLGLSETHAKTALDTVVRYLYPHALTPVQTIPFPESKRGGFHLQHRNMPQDSGDFDEATRQKIRDIFTPQPGWAIFDIGCFLGLGTLRLSGLVGPTGRVMAVEAMPANAAAVRYHLEMNKISNVTLYNNAIWHTAGEKIAINATSRQANAIAGDVITSGRKVDLITTSIAALTADLGRAADFASLTVNGAEVEALEKLDALPLDMRPRRMIMPGWYPSQGQPRAIVLRARLESLGYTVLVTSHHFVMAWRDDAQG